MSLASRRLSQTQPVSGAPGTNRREALLLALAAAFVVVGAVTLQLAYDLFELADLVVTCFAFSLAFGTVHLALSRHLPNRDPLLLPAGALLTGWGLLMVGRVAPNFLARQATWVLVSGVALLVVVRVGNDLSWLRRYRYTWLVGGLLLLGATLLLGVNPSGAGPRLWLGFAGAYFQPSEPLKLLMVVFLASYLAERRRLLISAGPKIGSVRLPPLAYVGPLLVMFGLAVLLLAAQQDLGAAMLFFLTFLSMLYLATGQWGYVAAGLTLFLGAGAVGYVVSSRLALRVDGWLNPWAGAADWSFQIVQSLLAFGAGGILGEGLGLGRPTYIPAVHTDFTFAAIGESFGLLGVLAVIGLYGVLLLRGFRAAAGVGRVFERYLAAGLTAGLIIQAWVIMAANVKLAPIAGVTLPFLSYGGSSLLSTFIVLGLLIRISDRAGRRSGAGRRTSAVSSERSSVQRTLLRTAGVLALALGALAVTCGYWSVARGDWLRAREDNPRRVLYEERIRRGRILDRDNEPLADIRIAPSGLVTRTYPVPEAAPVVGYATLRYGTGGIEAAHDEALRGEEGRGTLEEAWQDLLHRAPEGRDVQLTLDGGLQRLAQDVLDGKAGAAVLMEADSGRILAMASSPTFHPGHLEDAWDALREDASAPLLNRATQGLYQPGTALQTVVVAEALHEGVIEDFESDVGGALTERIPVDGSELRCSAPPEGAATLANAYAAGCPAPVGDLGERLGADGLAQAVARWGLADPPDLALPTEASNWSPEAMAASDVEAVGQGTLTVSPLQMALVAAAVGNDGVMPEPQLVAAVQDEAYRWRNVELAEPRTVLSAREARGLLAAWRRWEADGESREGEPMPGHWGIALAGEGDPHTWFIGVSQALEEGRYAVAVLVEHAADSRSAVRIGCRLLQAAQAGGE